MGKRAISAVFVYFALLVCVLVWFSVWPQYSVMFGDDLLYLYSEIEGRSLFEAIFDLNQVNGKYRPVLFLIMYLPVQIFKTDLYLYQAMNMVGLSLVAFGCYVLIKHITKNAVLSFTGAILLLSTPYNGYSFGVMFGMMEVLCILEIILMIYCCFRFFESDNEKWLVSAWLLFFVCIFTAERFMCLFPCFWVVIVLHRFKSKSGMKKVFACIAFLIPILFRQALLSSVGVNGFETGRGGVLDLISTIPIYLWREIVNLAGFAIGDPWHGGFKFEELSVINIFFATFNLFIFFGVLCYFIHEIICIFSSTTTSNIFKKIQVVLYDNKQLGYFVILLVFFIMNLAPYALVAKTHGEDRFLFPAYMILVNIVALIISTIGSKKCIYIIVTLMFAFRVTIDIEYSAKKDRTSWRYSYRTAQSCYDSILLNHNKEEIQEVYFVYPGTDYQWIFADQLFMKYYMNEGAKSYYVNDLENIPVDNGSGNVVYIVPNEDHQNHAFESKCVTYNELVEYGQKIE